MRLRRVKAAIGSVLAAVTLLSMSLTGVTAAQASDDNLALNQTVTASSYEVAPTAPEKAVDGDLGTRWGTAQNKAANEWIEVGLGGTKTVKQINIDFERKDADQNITSFKVELKQGDTYTKVYQKDTRAKQQEIILLDQAQQASAVKVTVLSADGGTMNWVNVGINEISVYSAPKETVLDTADTNHMLGATMTASSNETATLTPDKAIDQNRTGRNNRWASGYETPSNIWLKAEFPRLTAVKDIRIYFFERDVNPKPTNVQSFDLSYTDSEGTEHTLKSGYAMTASGAGYVADVVIQLDQAVNARSLKLSNFAIKSSEYNNVSVAEWEAYSNDQAEPGATLDSVVSDLESNHLTIETDTDTLALPTVPDGYTVKFNGADYEQLIAADGTVNHPLVDKTVQVAYVVTDTATGNTKTTSDIPYVVKGTNQQQEGNNAKPTIIPEIAEWHSTSAAKLAASAVTKVVYDDDSLKAVVDEFVADYKDFTGIKLTAKKGAAEAGAFNFVKTDSTAAIAQLGDEGYTMDIQADRVVAKSSSVTGNMYAMQTILQMTKQDANGFVIGSMRDYPRFTTRGLLLDVARKPVSLEMMREITRTMRYYKMNDFQAHLSDNYIFLENYGKGDNEDEAFKAYDAFRLESSLTNDKGESPTAEDYSISKKTFKQFIQDERALGMNVVPEIDVPAHANSFTKIWPELMVKGRVSPINSNRPLIDHLDVSKPETIAKIKEIFDDYTKGDDPTFDSDTTVHIGADEFLYNYTAYRKFINEIVPYIKDTNTVRMWGGLTWINDHKTEITKDAIENVEMNLWSKDWADGLQMYNMGYKLINTIDDYGYMVPNGSYGRANAYGDLLNISRVFDSFEPNKIRSSGGYQAVPSGDDQMLGAAFAIWSDNIDKSASGLTESDLYWRFFDAMPFYAEKTWAATGKEKGTAAKLTALAAKQGTGPRTNPYYQATSKNSVYESYDFNDGLADASGNGRDLTIGDGSKAAVKDQSLKLAGGSSYATSKLDKLGNGNELTFDVTLQQAAKPGDILFEADAPYGTHDIRVMENGKLGFTRELYNYYFDYELPVGKTVTVTIKVDQQTTKLYVDGEFVSDATGKYIDKGIEKKTGITAATFALPLQRIGSKTSAINGVIDNVIVKKSEAETDQYNKSCWTGTTNSETQYNDTEGLLRYAFDNNPSTIWHSNWKGATDKLTGSNSFYAEIDMCQKYTINQFSFTPRTSQDSGQVTKADLYVKANANDEWKQVATDQVFEASRAKKTFMFDEQEVRYVKFVAKSSNDGWVAVSEFGVANKPSSTVRVFVAADPAEGGTVSVAAEGETGTDTAVDVASGASVTAKAVAADGYRFSGWFTTASETAVSTDATYTFAADGNTALTAKFTKDSTPDPGPKPTISSIAVTKPTVTDYKVGDTFDATGLAVTATMSDGSTKTLTAGEYTLSATQDGAAVALDKAFAKAGKVTVTVTANGKTATFDVTVTAKDPDPEPATLKSIKVTSKPDKTTYTVDETFAKTGLAVTGTWSDGKTALLKDGEYKLSAVDADGKTVDLTKPFTAAGDVTVTVTSGKLTDSFTITVKAKTVTPAPGDNKPGENKPGADKPKPNTPDEVAKTGASVTAVVFSALLLLSAGYLLVRKRRI